MPFTPPTLAQIQIRRGLSTAWTSANPMLGAGEFGLETDTGKIKVGDGTTLWNSLSYFLPALAAVATSGSYNDLFGTPTLATVATTGSYNDLTNVPGGSATIVFPTQTIAGVYPTDAAVADIFDLTVNGVATIGNPTNPIDGKTLRWRIKQDAAGTWGVSLGAKFKLPSSHVGAVPWSTTVNATDLLAATYCAARDEWDVIAFVPGY